MTLTLLFVYAAALIALGWWSSRTATASDFFVAGRRLSPALLAGTLIAANIGAGSTVGAAGLGYRDGLAAWWWVGSAGLGSIVLALVVGPRIWRIAASEDHRTLGDFLKARFGPEVRALMAALLWFGSLAILAAQLIALGGLLQTVAGVPRAWGCVIGGVVATLYFATGGLLSSAKVNAVQVCVLVGGLLLALPFAWPAAGLAVSLPADVPVSYWSALASGGSGIVYLALLGPSFIVSPGLLQKVYGARDARAVRIGVLLNAVVLLAFAAVPVLLGMLARVSHPVLDNHELALPMLLRDDLPPWLGALALTALFSAEVSTADAVLFMLSTSVARDLYAGHLRPAATQDEQLRVVRGAAVIAGALGVGIAIWAGSIVRTMGLFYSVLSAGLFVAVIAGLFVPRAGRRHALATMLAGVVTTTAMHATTAGAGLVGLAPVVWGLLASTAALVVALGRARSPSGPSS
ncbi:sodium:solute symporter family protein [Luteitalea sp.]|uniref:sodium:solute symporter family protein n=1 Tax=Luteitalea sp. TaxID=2004800 RepID=UPI0025BB7C88|nr:sodium:solute symporter family protein [Luteitalea sp.]